MSPICCNGSGNNAYKGTAMLNWTLTFAPLVPAAILVGFALIAVALLVVLALGWRKVPLLRALALGCLLLALLNPQVLREDRERLTNIAVVISDDSDSQKFGDRATATANATREVVRRIEALDNMEVRSITVGRDTTERNGTALFSALNDTIADIAPERLGGVVMITDGQVHDVPQQAAQMGLSAPVHALITGREDETDRQLQLIKAPRFGLVGETQTAVIRVNDHGVSSEASAAVEIVLRRDGEALMRQMVYPGRDHEVDLDVIHGGETIFEIEVEARDNELSVVNNTGIIRLQGVREKLRVLLVSGVPHAGERVWRSLLKSDPSVDLVHFTILRPPEKQDGTPINQLSLIAFPTRELFSVKLHEFDLIIFDRYHRRGVLPVLYYDNIARYVRDGGALLLAAGPGYAGESSLFGTTLSSVLPAEPTGRIIEKPYRAELTPTGRRHPVTRDLSGSETSAWSRWFRLIAARDLGGAVIMKGVDDQPLLLVDRVDRGRVAVLLSDHVWLWARGYEGGGPHQQLLRRTAHWLMKEPELEEEVLTARIERDTIVLERRSIRDDIPLNVDITAPDGALATVPLRPVEPGLWRASMALSGFGLYRASDGERTALTHYGSANPREFNTLTSSQEILRPIAQQTGGLIKRIHDGDAARLPNIIPVRGGKFNSGANWMGLRSGNATVLRGIRQYSLLAGLLGLAVLLVVLSVTWVREAR